MVALEQEIDQIKAQGDWRPRVVRRPPFGRGSEAVAALSQGWVAYCLT